LLQRRNSAAPDLKMVKEISAQEFAAAVGMEIIPDEEDLPILSSSSNTAYSVSSSSTFNGRKYSFPPLDMAIFIPPGEEEEQVYQEGGIKIVQKGRFEMTVQKSSHWYAKPRKRSRTLSVSRFELVKDDKSLAEEELDQDITMPVSKSF
jgi:hypothetical protein